MKSRRSELLCIYDAHRNNWYILAIAWNIIQAANSNDTF